MANINSSRTQILFITIFSFLIFAQNVNSASFAITDFGPYQSNIKLEGNAFISNGSIYLTSPYVPKSAGRASYAAPVHLWNKKTGKLAAFTSSFAFVVAPTTQGLFGDGITFFIAPFNANIPKNSSGGYLGLVSAETALNSYQNQIVAVEFDSFSGNSWDPAFPHIGIDVNSIASVTTSLWKTGSVARGFNAFAFVSYEPVSKNLSVIVQYLGGINDVNGTSTTSVSFLIDLRTVLPEWVRIGFSGATGQLVELHKVLYWNFRSQFY